VSGPVSTRDTAPSAGGATPGPGIEVTNGRQATVGAFPVRRALPQRLRRCVGPWCFADHMGPASVTEDHGLDIGPHPHIGLQTVTWLLSGEVLHRDSLGSEQVIRPGQLNLMTAGHGVAHSEEATGAFRGELQGIQLWIAQPDATRDGDAAFEHHPGLPGFEVPGGRATVLVGSAGGTTSPARCDTEHVGVELELTRDAVLPLRPDFEYALIALTGEVSVGGRAVAPGQLGYLGRDGDELSLSVGQPTRVMLIGGIPIDEPLLMWWNYVARTRDEIDGAHRHWLGAHPRFGTVASPLPRITVGDPPWAAGPT
jgi:redox-sensitive bicupin YhaK (pirin superfamily)